MADSRAVSRKIQNELGAGLMPEIKVVHKKPK